MQVKGRWVLGLCGLALGVPAAAMAQQPGDAPPPAAAAQPGAPDQAHHHHHHLFGRRHCVECQRAYVKAHDGVDVPPPPALEPGAIPVGVLGAKDCPTCQSGMVVAGPVMAGNAAAPGYAVAGPGGPAVADAGAPGYAVVGGELATGADPAPIGTYRGGQTPSASMRMAAAGTRPAGGPYDPAVVPTNLPPGQTALANPHNRPHIISHLLGFSEFGRGRREQEEKDRQKHAAIAYDQPNQVVTELPASMVYGNGGKPAK
jgi:hypothetical protein